MNQIRRRSISSMPSEPKVQEVHVQSHWAWRGDFIQNSIKVDATNIWQAWLWWFHGISLWLHLARWNAHSGSFDDASSHSIHVRGETLAVIPGIKAKQTRLDWWSYCCTVSKALLIAVLQLHDCTTVSWCWEVLHHKLSILCRSRPGWCACVFSLVDDKKQRWGATTVLLLHLLLCVASLIMAVGAPVVAPTKLSYKSSKTKKRAML